MYSFKKVSTSFIRIFGCKNSPLLTTVFLLNHIFVASLHGILSPLGCTGPPFAPIFLQTCYQSMYSFASFAHILPIHPLPKGTRRGCAKLFILSMNCSELVSPKIDWRNHKQGMSLIMISMLRKVIFLEKHNEEIQEGISKNSKIIRDQIL